MFGALISDDPVDVIGSAGQGPNWALEITVKCTEINREMKPKRHCGGKY